MKQLKIMVLSKKKIKRRFFKITATAIGLYLIISLYFINHFFFQTEINGVNVSLKSHSDGLDIISQYVNTYELQLIERDGAVETISSKDIQLQRSTSASTIQVERRQNPLFWIASLFKVSRYRIKNLYEYDSTLLNDKIDDLNCLNGKITAPKNASFQYKNGVYEIVKEVEGNKVHKDRFVKMINTYLSLGKTSLNLNSTKCYEKPKFKINSAKTLKTKNLLNKYVGTKIIYDFGSTKEQLDSSIIHQWLSVNENLNVVINRHAVEEYVRELGDQYNTIGVLREFQSATGKKMEVSGGIYGWKINGAAETDALIKNIKKSGLIKKEPIYSQKGVTREGNEIGDTYVEINITRQHLWFFKNGKLIVQGSVVTGNPNRGNATVLGVYMLNYKQKDATLSGPGYEAPVTYWMPFFGNIGLHDASWRYRFGGEIYKRNGSHGCVNAPVSVAKKVFENIEAGIPIIVYEE
jgi:hypothetical protein